MVWGLSVVNFVGGPNSSLETKTYSKERKKRERETLKRVPVLLFF